MNTKAVAKQNKLLEIAINTSDKMLSELCMASANMYKYYIERFKTRVEHMIPNPNYKADGIAHIRDNSIPYNNNEWVNMQARVNRKLTEYVEMAIGAGKSAWQIEAERNGWVKP